MDPLSLIAMASTTFKGIQTLVNRGAEIEHAFDWKADGTHQKYGVIAQELIEVAPEAVSVGDDDDKTMAVDHAKLVPMMIKEIQDLKAEVAALKGA